MYPVSIFELFVLPYATREEESTLPSYRMSANDRQLFNDYVPQEKALTLTVYSRFHGSIYPGRCPAGYGLSSAP